MYTKPVVEVIEFSDEEVVMNVVASSLVPDHEHETELDYDDNWMDD